MKRFLGFWVFWLLILMLLAILFGNLLIHPYVLFVLIALIPAGLTSVLLYQNEKIAALEKRIEALEGKIPSTE